MGYQLALSRKTKMLPFLVMKPRSLSPLPCGRYSSQVRGEESVICPIPPGHTPCRSARVSNGRDQTWLLSPSYLKAAGIQRGVESIIIHSIPKNASDPIQSSGRSPSEIIDRTLPPSIERILIISSLRRALSAAPKHFLSGLSGFASMCALSDR